MKRLIGCVGYIERPQFEFDCPGDRLQVESMLAARQDDILAVHWDDLDSSLATSRAFDVRRGSWTSADLSQADALLILEAPAPGSTSADFDHADALMRVLVQRRMPAVNSPRTFLEYPDKRYLVERPDMPFPATRLVTAESDLPRALDGLGETVILKPLIGAGGQGVTRLPAVADTVRQAMEPGQEYLIQEFLPEIAHGERSLYFFAKRYRYAIVKRPQAGDFRCNEIYAVNERYEPTPEEVAIASDAIERFNSPSLIERIDMCGTKIIEMTIECPGLKIALCGIQKEIGVWTYEAIDRAKEG